MKQERSIELQTGQLIKTLEKEISLYQQMLSLFQKERELLIISSHDDLYNLLNQKETLILQLKGMESIREGLVDEIYSFFMPSSEEKTLSSIIRFIGEPYKEKLRDCHSRLFALLQSVREISELNGAIFDRSLDHVRDALLILGNMTSTNPVYSSSGSL